MANLRKHRDSPYWYVRWRNQDSGAWTEFSTGLRFDNRADTLAAQRTADKYSIKERQNKGVGVSPAFAVWVPQYIASHFLGDSKRRYGGAWQAIRAFLVSSGIIYPRQIKYGHGEAYINWRLATAVHGRKVVHNTALLELKFLSQLMNEAIRREFTETNPLANLGIARTAQKIKPELSDEDIERLRQALKDQPDWMRICFEISLYTGCRFSECSIPIENIDLRNRTLRLRDAKRKENDPRKHFTVPIHNSLYPTLVKLTKSGVKLTCRLSSDKNGRINKLFKKCGVNASFHSLRVTFITRCHRGGLSESEAMRLANHSSQLVHRIYSRLNVEDVRKAQRKIPLP